MAIVSVKEIENIKREGCIIVATNGCFDLLHPGHVALLEKAKSFGDVLIVAINSDNSVQRLKGPSRPIMSMIERATMVNALRCVDYVIIFDEDTPKELYKRILPDVLVKGPDYSGVKIAGSEYSGRVEIASPYGSCSTTKIIEEIKNA